MPKAVKLKSGRWRCQAFDHIGPNGENIRKSFTADTKREAERLAAMWQSDRKREKNAPITFDAAAEQYIESKAQVLSPGTVKTYRGYRINHFDDFKDKPVADITRSDVQKYINKISKTLTPKTVFNIHGFIAAVLKEYNPDFVLNTKLPQKQKTEMPIPTKEELQIILEESEKIQDKDLYLAILLASHLGLRRGEVCALDWSDIDLVNKQVNISKSLSITPDKTFVEKSPKSYSGFRQVPIPAAAFEKLKQYASTGQVIHADPAQLTNRWKRFKAKVEMNQFSYHNLRHYYASVLLDAGVPDKYAMEIMGHSTNRMLKEVYQHTNKETMKVVSEKLDAFF